MLNSATIFTTIDELIAKPCYAGKSVVISFADVIVVFAAVLVNLIFFLGGTFNYMPDSGNYVIFAAQIVNDGTYPSSPVRLIGYPAFLSGFYALLGEHFLFWVTAVQHLLLVGCAIAIKRMVYSLTSVMVISTLAGLFSAFSFQLVSYASMPMTEVLFATLVTFALMFAVEPNNARIGQNLIISVTLLSFATLIKPSALYFPIFLIGVTFFRTTFFCNKDTSISFKSAWIKAGIASVLFIAIVTPIMIKNKIDHGHFKLVAYLGQNLYSNTVEYGNFWDENSDATIEIKQTFEKWVRQKKETGIPINENNTWHNHWPATTAYLDITGKSFWDGDAIFQRAAIDAILAHPMKFITHVFSNLRISLMYVESTVLYVPGYYEEGSPKPSYLPEALPLAWPDRARMNIVNVLEDRGDTPMPRLEFSEESIFTPIYGKLAHYYYRIIVEFGNLYFALIVLGLCYTVVKFVKTREFGWFIILGGFLYFFILPNVIVPGSPRHRLPADPLIASFAAIGFMAFIMLMLDISLKAPLLKLTNRWRNRR